MGDDSKIPNVERGSDKIQHDDFMPSPTENKRKLLKMKKKQIFPYNQFEWKKVSLK